MPEPENGPVFGSFRLVSYGIHDGKWQLWLTNPNPGGGMFSEWDIEFALDEIAPNTSQNTLSQMIKERLGWKYNRTMPNLNLAIANNMTVTLP